MNNGGHKKPRIVPFGLEHYARMRLRTEDAADLAGLEIRGLAENWKRGRTVLAGDEPVLIYGSVLDEGVGLIWAVTSTRTGSFPLLVTRLGRVLVGDLFLAGAHRVEAYCHRGNRRSLRWLTRGLGFRVEGLMRRSGPNGQDRYLLSVLPEEWRHAASAARARKMLAELGEIY